MNQICGVDIGVGSIKVVALNKEDGKVSLVSIGEIKNPAPEWLKDGEKGGIANVASAIKSLWSDLKIGKRQVVTSLPEDEVVSRLIRLPPLKENEIKDALRFEAETFIPYPLSEVSIDYEIIDEDEAGRLSVFAIAARNKVIESYLKVYKMAGLEMNALESPAVAMRRIVNAAVSDTAAIMLVDLGEKYSDIVSISGGKVYFTRAMSVGGESITRAISVNLGLDMASAEEYKKAYGMKEMELEGKIKTSILPVFASMAEEIRRALGAFREDQGRPAEVLVLSGGGANLPGLAEELTKILGIEVQVIQPFLKIDSSKLVLPIDLNSEGCRYTLAAGLALRGLV